jgi:DNA-binding response OmpR family regulator
MSTLLLLEDDPSLGATLKEGLESRGFSVSWAQDCGEARRLLSSRAGDPGQATFDLAILDVSLPDGSGFDLAGEIRKRQDFPFVFMTAMNSAENRLAGYDLGAEEFIPKPFHFRELLIRIEHVLKTHSSRARSRIQLPAGTLDLDKMCLEHSSGRTSFIALRDFRVLKLLIEQSPRPVSRDEMLDLIWGEDQFPTQRTVDNCIVRLRQLLEDTEGRLIRSVRGMGYQWIQEGDAE